MNYEIYRYIPKKEIKNAAVIAGIFLFATAALWIISVFVRDFKTVYIFSGIISATAAAQVTTRFIISGYIYILDKTDFIVVKANGAKSTQVCNIPLGALEGIAEKGKKNAETEKQFGKAQSKINYCQNLFSGRAYCCIFDFDDKKTLIKFEADEKFIAEMKKRAEYAKSESWFD